MQVPATQVPLVDVSNRSADESVSLLTEVDFKWLMAGHGWWMDTTRFHRDPTYAAGLLGLAMASESFALELETCTGNSYNNATYWLYSLKA